ncbi:type I restriction endonuclease [Schaalia canis]|uniref:Restriction endonuclease n=1 Tax=Schaalia canis TaxID=100469 RepID=A0A3P1SCI8_9ACTO|nr:type I restriction endonuclease [Schaalia canis]RRC94677.1 restriction endonuclease [Schaalia canis]
MEFTDALTLLAGKVKDHADSLQTEEATKNALIMPFISNVLGYDVFNPQEVIPEYTADVGIKRGEKIDYAIMTSGEMQILIECKAASVALKLEHASQLYRYFGVTSARIAVLTNGKVWNFYTDLDAPNKMDSKPFLVLDLEDIDETILPDLRKLTKDRFDLSSVINAAEELKYLGALRRNIANEFKEPSPEFVRFWVSRVYEGRCTQAIQEKFTSLVEKALRQYLSERINDRLKTALGADENVVLSMAPNDEEAEPESSPEEQEITNVSDVVTTEEELHAFRIIKAIACAELDPARIGYRDAKSYFTVLADDNNRKPILRCYFNAKSTKWIAFLDEERNMTRVDIDGVEDLYLYVDQIREAAKRYA